jgi:2-polyprenyl-3-methyl-5-hydroxy-6-metoxy-1,4-benzoquinol methylase
LSCARRQYTSKDLAQPVTGEKLANEPKKFFMTLRDIAFWVGSARTDAALEKLRVEHGSEKAFDLLYSRKSDPFSSGLPCYRYQKLKYQKLISFLPKRHYPNVLDVGCGVGPFTRELSPHAGRVLGVDLSEQALIQALNCSRDYPNLRFEQRDIQHIGKIRESFDLIAVLDVLYYLPNLSNEMLESVAGQLESLLAPGGLLLLVNHFFFHLDPASRQTRRIHNSFQANSSLQFVSENKRAFYLASVYSKRNSAEKPEGTEPTPLN